MASGCSRSATRTTRPTTFPSVWNRNEPSFALWKQLQQPVFDSKGRPVRHSAVEHAASPIPSTSCPTSPARLPATRTLPSINCSIPFRCWAASVRDRPTGKNGYDALQTKIERRYHNGLSLISAFTWSKLLEDTSFLGPQIAGPKIEHKLGGEDRPYVLALTGIWDLPFGRGRRWGGNLSRPLNLLVGGWEMTGNYSASSGVPVVFGDRLVLQRAERGAQHKTQRTLERWFDTNQFVAFPNREHRHLELSGVDRHPADAGSQLQASVPTTRSAMASTRTSPPISATIRRAGAIFASRASASWCGSLQELCLQLHDTASSFASTRSML